MLVTDARTHLNQSSFLLLFPQSFIIFSLSHPLLPTRSAAARCCWRLIGCFISDHFLPHYLHLPESHRLPACLPAYVSDRLPFNLSTVLPVKLIGTIILRFPSRVSLPVSIRRKYFCVFAGLPAWDSASEKLCCLILPSWHWLPSPSIMH